MKSILITGASGFIGSSIVDMALKKGYEVWAGVRKTSSKKYLMDERINFIELNFENSDDLFKSIKLYSNQQRKWDYIIHCAGVTKCLDRSEFDKINNKQTRYFVECLLNLKMVPKQFFFISSLSVFGPINETTYMPILDSDTAIPNTAYGKSKLSAEKFVTSIKDFPYVIFRPTGVYGPREKDYFLMVKSIKNHIDFSVGYKRQDITFIYVKDLASAIFDAIKANVSRRSYFLSDGNVYSSSSFSNLIKKEMKIKFVLSIKSPIFILKIVSLFAECISKINGRSSTLNLDKYRILKQRNWQCDISPAINDFNFNPKYNLNMGVKETINWYKKEGWV